MESATASMGSPGELEDGNAVTRASGMPFSREQSDERVLDFAGLVALQRKRAVEEGDALFEDFEEFVVLPPDEVDEARREAVDRRGLGVSLMVSAASLTV